MDSAVGAGDAACDWAAAAAAGSGDGSEDGALGELEPAPDIDVAKAVTCWRTSSNFAFVVSSIVSVSDFD